VKAEAACPPLLSRFTRKIFSQLLQVWASSREVGLALSQLGQRTALNRDQELPPAAGCQVLLTLASHCSFPCAKRVFNHRRPIQLPPALLAVYTLESAKGFC